MLSIRFHQCLLIAVLVPLLAPTTLLAASTPVAETLPLEVRIDLLREQLSQHLRSNNHQGIVDLMPQFRALDLEFPDNLYYLEGRALHQLGRALEAQDRLVIYLRNTGRDGAYYQEATDLLLAVKEEAAIQERQRAEQERLRREELAQRAEKARALLVREAQQLLTQLGFRQAEETGELTKPTREALAIYQVRRDLTVNGEVTNETLAALKQEVPLSHNCDGFAPYPRTPREFGVPIAQIAAQVAVPSCSEAVRQYPDVVRLQVQLARALAAAGRNQDALKVVEKAAGQGYPEAETLIGWLHENGRISDNGRPDPASALPWYRRAADRDYPEAQLSIGRLHAAGSAGLRRDYEAAAEWIARAANQGYPPAQTELANLYAAGRGVGRDYGLAAEWLTRAADAGYPDALFALGEQYERGGSGVKRDKAAAIEWFKRAVQAGHPRAADRLRRLGG